MPERMELRLGEERAVHLPAEGAPWTWDVRGMASAVDVRKLWAADPYPDDDEGEDDLDHAPSDVVFTVRAVAPGEATVRFAPAAGPGGREVTVEVRT